MDNAIDAIKIAFAVLVFVIALTISMVMFTKAREVSEKVFHMTDQTSSYTYMSDVKLDGNGDPVLDKNGEPIRIVDYGKGRIVSAEAIVPMLYRYNKEHLNIVILDKGNIIAKYNLDEETINNERWVGHASDEKLRIDYDLAGPIIPSYTINGYKYEPQYNKPGGLYKYLNSNKFRETFFEQRYSGKEIISEDNESIELVKGNTKTWIIYEKI